MIHSWLNKPEVLKEIRRHKQTAFILKGHMFCGNAALCSFQSCGCGCLWWILLWSPEDSVFVVVVIWVPPNSKILLLQLKLIATLIVFLFSICIKTTAVKKKIFRLMFSNEKYFYFIHARHKTRMFLFIPWNIKFQIFCVSHSSVSGQPGSLTDLFRCKMETASKTRWFWKAFRLTQSHINQERGTCLFVNENS